MPELLKQTCAVPMRKANGRERIYTTHIYIRVYAHAPVCAILRKYSAVACKWVEDMNKLMGLLPLTWASLLVVFRPEAMEYPFVY